MTASYDVVASDALQSAFASERPPARSLVRSRVLISRDCCVYTDWRGQLTRACRSHGTLQATPLRALSLQRPSTAKRHQRSARRAVATRAHTVAPGTYAGAHAHLHDSHEHDMMPV